MVIGTDGLRRLVVRVALSDRKVVVIVRVYGIRW